MNITQLNQPGDEIEGLLCMIAASIGYDINEIFRSNNTDVLADVELNTKILED